MKPLTLFALSIILCYSLSAQDVKTEQKKAETKMDAFSSKTDTIIRFIDTNLPDLKLLYEGSADTRVRILNSGSETLYFYEITKTGQYNSSTASIEYSDLLEVIKALKNLKEQVNKDVASNADYLENKFATEDGFQVGYLIQKGKATWYMKLEKYSSDATIFIKDGDSSEDVFTNAKNKIDELKK